MDDTILGRPIFISKNIRLFFDSNRQILVPCHRPIGIRCLVEKNASDGNHFLREKSEYTTTRSQFIKDYRM